MVACDSRCSPCIASLSDEAIWHARVSVAETPLLPFPLGHGGRRAGAGRKPKGDRAGVSHGTRGALAARFPVHVTVKLREHLPPLRRRDAYAALRAAFAAGCDRNGFRLIHYAVLEDHLHFVVEATGRSTLSRGVQGLLIRVSRTLTGCGNASDESSPIATTTTSCGPPARCGMRCATCSGTARSTRPKVAPSPFPRRSTPTPRRRGSTASARRSWCDSLEAVVRPVTDAHTWLLTIGWRRHGLLSVTEVPA
jgi:REP element-mobilizing transposase RayT